MQMGSHPGRNRSAFARGAWGQTGGMGGHAGACGGMGGQGGRGAWGQTEFQVKLETRSDPMPPETRSDPMPPGSPSPARPTSHSKPRVLPRSCPISTGPRSRRPCRCSRRDLHAIVSSGLRRPPQERPGRNPQRNQTNAGQGLNAALQIDQHVAQQQDRGDNVEQRGVRRCKRTGLTHHFSGLTHHNSELRITGKPCLLVKPSFWITYSQRFDSLLTNTVQYNWSVLYNDYIVPVKNPQKRRKKWCVSPVYLNRLARHLFGSS